MKVDVVDLEGKKKESIDLPIQFSEDYEPSLVKRAILAFVSKLRQKYGAYPRAGKNVSATLSRRRKDYKTAYGKGISRVPRKTMWRRGLQFGWTGAFAPGTTGGRRAHPPKSSKNWVLKINKKENSKAIRSALGGLVGMNKLIVIVPDVEKLSKAKDVSKVFDRIGLGDEMERVSERKIRAGRGKSRGRKYKTKVGPLFVVANDCALKKSVSNMLGCGVVDVHALNVNILAQGHSSLRYVIFTKTALDKMGKENLFMGIRK